MNIINVALTPMSFRLVSPSVFIPFTTGLSRDMLVCVAIMSGCDYTTGIERVGPQTAIKILKEFKIENEKNVLEKDFESLVNFK